MYIIYADDNAIVYADKILEAKLLEAMINKTDMKSEIGMAN